MSISPPSDRSRIVPVATGNPGGKSGLSAEERARRAEREAQQKITESTEQIREAQKEADVQLDHVRDQYVKQSESEATRQEAQIEDQKLRGYERLRELQRQQNSELARTKRQGERDLQKLQDYYRDAIYGTERKGNEDLEDVRSRQARMLTYQQKSANHEIENSQDTYQKQMALMKANQEHALQTVSEANRAEYERVKQETEQAMVSANESLGARYKKVVDEQTALLQKINSRAQKDLNTLRKDTEQKLAAYGSRQEDPFYRMMSFDAELHETAEAYLLVARVPEHEQKNISVTIKGNQLVVQGQRRNEEKLDLSPGHQQRTASFQSFSEAFPIPLPVEPKLLTREYDGELLSIILPKRSSASPIDPPRPKSQPERARAERPDWPLNLPGKNPRKDA